MSLNPSLTDWDKQHVWLVGASSIGVALARALARTGARVILFARTKIVGLEKLANDCPDTVVMPMDVRVLSEWQSCYRQIHYQVQRIGTLIFCTGTCRLGCSWDIEENEIKRTLEPNLVGIYIEPQTILPDFMQGLPNATAHPPSKTALINLAELLYCDLHSKSIGVYLINPSFVRIPLTAQNNFPMATIQTPERAAECILHGLAKGRIDIDFPKRFARLLKFMSNLPYRWRFALLRPFEKLM